MLRRLFSLTLISLSGFALQTSGFAAVPTSLGPTSASEAQILWNDAQVEFEKAHYPEASLALKRFVARYPGHPGFLEAHFLLGKTYLRLNQPTEALPMLQHFVQAQRPNPAQVMAQLEMGECLLQLKRFSEVLTLCLEIESNEKVLAQSHFTLPLSLTEIQLQRLLIKASALLGLGSVERAESVLQGAQRKVSESSPSDKKGTLARLKLQIKLHSCAQFQMKHPMNEAQAKNLMDRRGVCLKEALLDWNEVLRLEVPTEASRASQLIHQSFHDYLKACLTPPPPQLPPTERLQRQERKRYQIELADYLLKTFEAQTQEALDLLLPFKPLADSKSLPAFTQLSSQLQQLKALQPLKTPHRKAE
ncbi:MAG: tetratricopeptide repeat protein [Bdellovibrionia bacterium]